VSGVLERAVDRVGLDLRTVGAVVDRVIEYAGSRTTVEVDVNHINSRHFVYEVSRIL